DAASLNHNVDLARAAQHKRQRDVDLIGRGRRKSDAMRRSQSLGARPAEGAAADAANATSELLDTRTLSRPSFRRRFPYLREGCSRSSAPACRPRAEN